MSATKPFNVAIETASARGTVSLGRDHVLLQTAEIPQPRRHNVDLVPLINQLCQEHGAQPGDIGEIYLSIGPGSFTGLRIAVATAKMMAMVLGAQVVAVPTLDVVAQNAPAPAADQPGLSLAVCLNLKRASMYTGLYRWSGQSWEGAGEPALRTMEELLAAAPRPLAILGSPLPPPPEPPEGPQGQGGWEQPGVTILPEALAIGRSEIVWALGQTLAAQQRWADPMTLTPLYVRPPEAVELWNKREKESQK